MDLSNRELAALLWLGLFAAILLAWPQTRSNVLGLLGQLFQRVFLVVFGLASAYIILCVMLLGALGVWNWALLSTTLIWVFTVAFVGIFQANRIEDDKGFFRDIIRDTISVTAFVLFIVEFHPFGLVTELLLLQILTFFGLLHGVAQIKKEHAQVERFLGSILALIGIGLFAYSSYRTVLLWQEFWTPQTGRSLAVPALLTFMFLPFLYLLSRYMVYERVFGSLLFVIEDKKLRGYAKRRAVLAFRTDLKLLDRWRRDVHNQRPGSKVEIRETIATIKRLDRREKEPPDIAPSAEGWSPYEAKEFLAGEGLVAGDYHKSFESWWASTPYLEIGEGPIMKDNIAYYIEGDDQFAKQLRLKLHINNPGGDKEAETRFYALAGKLVECATAAPASELTLHLSAKPDTLDTIAAGRRVRLTRDEFVGGLRGGYSRTLIVDNSAAGDWSPY